ncbi:hypothetical protein X772_24715 [Mesorhizobium sp. LSJC280B00]|nr:hypothetical protein X772_24715 [Mesorhizobium sp. LSJC280B00]
MVRAGFDEQAFRRDMILVCVEARKRPRARMHHEF